MKKIHIIGYFATLPGGTALECLELAQKLEERGNNVSVWATGNSPVSNSRLKQHGVTRMRRFLFPMTGTLVISAGCIKPPRIWSLFAHFRRAGRVIVICNNMMVKPENILKRYNGRTRQKPELVFLSTTQPSYSEKHVSAIHPSPITIENFEPKQYSPAGTRDAIVIGRLSRDVVKKHHPEDPALYRKLVSQGIHVKLMGASQLEQYDPEITNCKGISFLETEQETASEFLASLDIFFYRKSPDRPETFGRVVAEAMLTGLPVVCGDVGGYSSLIKHGINGFLCRNTAEAYSILSQLADNAELRKQVGWQARRDMLELYSSKAMADRLKFYEE